MKQSEFLEILRKKLAAQRTPDIEDVAGEYSQHFLRKLADGYTEEEIAAKLGDPEDVAQQFLPDRPVRSGSRLITALGLGWADLLLGVGYAPLFGGGVAAIGGSAFAFLVGGVILLFQLKGALFFVPDMPYGCALLFGLSLLALGVLAALGTWYCAAFFGQSLRAYGRWHKNLWSSASGGSVYPALSPYPQFAPKTRRLTRSVALPALALFIVTLAGAYIASALTARAWEFWHVWAWFV
jgi:uncharacterized membrane protein